MTELSETLRLPLATGKIRQLLTWLVQLLARPQERWDPIDFTDHQLRDIGVTRFELERERNRWT